MCIGFLNVIFPLLAEYIVIVCQFFVQFCFFICVEKVFSEMKTFNSVVGVFPFPENARDVQSSSLQSRCCV